MSDWHEIETLIMTYAERVDLGDFAGVAALFAHGTYRAETGGETMSQAGVAAVQTTESGQPVLLCLSRRPFTKQSIQDFAEKSQAAPAMLVTDGLGCFTAVRGRGILHEQHITGGGAASAKHPSFLAVNTALGNLKTALAGTYLAFGFRKYAHRYLGQVQYLFNRRFDLRGVLERFGSSCLSGRTMPSSRRSCGEMRQQVALAV